MGKRLEWGITHEDIQRVPKLWKTCSVLVFTRGMKIQLGTTKIHKKQKIKNKCVGKNL